MKRILSFVSLLCAGVAPIAGPTGSVLAAEQVAAYPSRPVRIIAPYAPGGTTDILSRIVAEQLSLATGQQVLVDNRACGGGTIGSDMVARAVPDGHTLMITPSGSHTANPSLYAKLPYDTVRDFAAVSLIASVANLIVTHPSSPINSLQDLIAAARTPGKVSYASAGSGTVGHLSAEMLRSIAKIDMVHVPYKGGGPALAAIVSNETTVMFAALPSATPFVRSGRIKPLAVTSPKRVSALPSVPTVAEAGVPGIAVIEWYGLFAPGRTPTGIVDKLSREVARIVRIPEVASRMNELGAEPVGSDPKTLHDQVVSDIRMWTPIVKDAGVRAD